MTRYRLNVFFFFLIYQIHFQISTKFFFFFFFFFCVTWNKVSLGTSTLDLRHSDHVEEDKTKVMFCGLDMHLIFIMHLIPLG